MFPDFFPGVGAVTNMVRNHREGRFDYITENGQVERLAGFILYHAVTLGAATVIAGNAVYNSLS